MRLCGNLAIFLLLTWPSDTAGKKGRGGTRGEKKNGIPHKGEFTGRGRERIMWAASGENPVTLRITCVDVEKGKPGRGYTCEYTAEPALCPGFVRRPDAFWRHISRSLKQNKQHLCRAAHEPIQARMCKTAPTGAHFRLANAMTEITMTTAGVAVELPEDTSATECTRRAGHHELAREKCGSAWASFCNLLFSVVESKD